MRRFFVLALVLLSLSAEWVAGAEPNAPAAEAAVAEKELPPSTEFLVRAFLLVFKPEQLAQLDASPTPEYLVGIMSSEQKEQARTSLKKAEGSAKEPALLAEIERGYSLLSASADLFRIGMRRKGLLGEDVSEMTAAASKAYDEGRKEDAVRLAAEALARNPDDKAAFAIFMLAKPKVQPKELNLKNPFGEKPVGETEDGAVAAKPLEPSAERTTSPEAQAIMRQVVQARRSGELEATLRLALDAMRADPTSPTVQKLYLLVIDDRAKQLRRVRQTVGFLEQAMDAERAGDRDRAVALAEQAAAVDPHPTVLKIVQELRSLPRTAGAETKVTSSMPKEQRKGLPPLVPTAAVMAGVLLLAWAATPQTVKDRFRQELWENPKQELKIGAAALVTAAIVYGGWSVLAAAPAATTGAPAAAQLAYAGAGAGGGGMLSTAIAWEQAAVGALKAGTITLAAMFGVKATANQRRAQRESSDSRQTGNSQGDPSRPPAPAPVPVLLPLPTGAPTKERGCSFKPAEDILLRFVDETRLASGYLRRHEDNGGHTIEKHVGKSREYLIGRLREVKTAGSYNDILTAEAVTRRTIDANREDIEAWFGGESQADQDFHMTGGSGLRPFGYAVSRGNPDPTPRYDSAIVLRKAAHCQILILTSFPE